MLASHAHWPSFITPERFLHSVSRYSQFLGKLSYRAATLKVLIGSSGTNAGAYLGTWQDGRIKELGSTNVGEE